MTEFEYLQWRVDQLAKALLFARGGKGVGTGTAVVPAPVNEACPIDVSQFPGTNFGSKLQNAINSLPATGGVLDCRCMTGAQSIASTVTVPVKCQILFGASEISIPTGVTAFQVTGGLESGAYGSVFDGCGYATRFLVGSGATAFDIACQQVTVRRLLFAFQASNAANRGIVLRANSHDYRLEELLFDGFGLSIGTDAGRALDITTSYKGLADKCAFLNFAIGAKLNGTDPDIAACNDDAFRKCRFHNCDVGLDADDFQDLFVQDCIFEDCHTGFHCVAGYTGIFSGNHWEQQNVATDYDVVIDTGIFLAFLGDHFATSGSGGGIGRNIRYSDPNPGFAVHVIACFLSSGCHTPSGGSIDEVECYEAGGAGNTGSFSPNVVTWLQGRLTSARFRIAKSQDVVAANDLSLGYRGNQFTITGNTQINAVVTADWEPGSSITLIFTGTPTVKHNTAGGAGTAVLLLAGSVDLVVAAANTVLRLEYDGTQWQETSRKIP
jgi:hypothetical protein